MRKKRSFKDYKELLAVDKVLFGRFYKKYFEGYVEYRVSNAKGKRTKIVRVYAGDYFRLDLPDKKRRLYKLLYVAIWLFAALLFLVCVTRNSASNFTWFVVLTEIVSFLMLLLSIITIGYYVTAKRDMTIYTYKTTAQRLGKVSAVTAGCLGVTAFAMLVFTLLNLSEEPLMNVLCIFGYIAGSFAMYMISKLQTKMKYIKVPSTERPPEGAVEIRSL